MPDIFPSHRCYEPIKYQEVSEEEILKKKLFHVFVLSLPRSGSSMMTHICELLGVKMFHTTEIDKKYNEQFPKDPNDQGDTYHPNPNGFFEIVNNPFENFLNIISTPYSGCKLIIPARHAYFDLMRVVPSKVILMERDPEEIRQSQNAFYAQDADYALLRTLYATERVKLRQGKIDFLTVNYRNVVKNPAQEIQKVKEFILSDAPIDEAVKFVDPKLYRFDADKIVKGI